MTKRAVIIAGHGSRLAGFQKTMEQVARELRRDSRYPIVTCAYLEISAPSIAVAIERSVQKGADEIRILPYFLLMGNHVKTDIPRLAALERKKYKRRVKIVICPYLGYHKNLLAVVKDRLKETVK